MLLSANADGPSAAFMRANRDRATIRKLWQYRYVYFLDRRARRDLAMWPLPYPKP